VLESKPGAARVGARLGDMTALALEGPYTLVFVAFNTLFNLPDDAAQARCLGEVRRVLAPGGHLVIEAAVPAVVADDRPIHHDERRDDGAGGTIWTITTHEPATRTIHGVHVHRRGDGTTVDRPWRIHYLAPPLLDAMCEAAGLALASRWSDWSGTPWQPDDDRHVSVYRLARPLDPATGPHAP
jgi:SAM-dependent methyltransferase